MVIFWPSDIYRLELKDNTTVIGEIKEREEFFLHQDGKKIPEGFRIQVKRGNRDLYGDDYIWINEDDITSKSQPDALTVFERLEWGNFYGVIEEFRESDKTLATGQDQALAAFQKEMPEVESIRDEIKEIEKFKIGKINHEITQHQLKIKRLALDGITAGSELTEQETAIKELKVEYENYVSQLSKLRSSLNSSLLVRTGDNREKTILLQL